MADRRATRLVKHLRMREISLVDEGDNPHADVLIVKARDPGDRARAILEDVREDVEHGGFGMTELEKRLAEIETELTTLEKRAADAEALVAVEKARADKAEGELATVTEELAKAKAPAADTDEDIFKGLPVALRTRFEAVEKRALVAEAALNNAAEQGEINASIAKAKELGLDDDAGNLLHRIAKGRTTPDDAGKVEAILKQAKVGSAILFKSIGTNVAEGADEEAILKEKAEAIQKAKGVTYEVAYSEALDANPALYGAIVTKRRLKQQGQ